MIDIILYPILIGIIVYGIMIVRIVMNYQSKEIIRDIVEEARHEQKTEQISTTAELPTGLSQQRKQIEK
ncbi:hypothetical protein [Bacillus tuaregi]|uniref:hypothetical protein n=1 Tax=Bacillus tuaregi TaxID=1816695 RepID=UPI0008F930CB|nr:hypothetical protein [Bacillus tuaregi]